MNLNNKYIHRKQMYDLLGSNLGFVLHAFAIKNVKDTVNKRIPSTGRICYSKAYSVKSLIKHLDRYEPKRESMLSQRKGFVIHKLKEFNKRKESENY